MEKNGGGDAKNTNRKVADGMSYQVRMKMQRCFFTHTAGQTVPPKMRDVGVGFEKVQGKTEQYFLWREILQKWRE